MDNMGESRTYQRKDGTVMSFMGKMTKVQTRHKIAGRIEDVGGVAMRPSEKFAIYWNWFPYEASPKDFQDIIVNKDTKHLFADERYGKLHWHYYIEPEEGASEEQIYEEGAHKELKVNDDNFEEKIKGCVRVECFFNGINDTAVQEIYGPVKDNLKKRKAKEEETDDYSPLLRKTKIIPPFMHFIPESIINFNIDEWLLHLARELVKYPLKIPKRAEQYKVEVWITIHSDGIGRSLRAATFFTGKIFVTGVPDWLKEAIPSLKTRTFVVGGMRGKDNNTRKYMEPIIVDFVIACSTPKTSEIAAGPDKAIYLKFDPSRILISMDFASIAEATGVKAGRICAHRATFGKQNVREMGCVQYHVPVEKTIHTLQEFREWFEKEEEKREEIEKEGGKPQESKFAFREDRMGPICYRFLDHFDGMETAQITPTVFHNSTGISLSLSLSLSLSTFVALSEKRSDICCFV